MDKQILDRCILVFVGVALAALAWVFWSQLGSDSFDVFAAIVIVAQWLAIRESRRRLKELQEQYGFEENR
jgi:hypothetical protein